MLPNGSIAVAVTAKLAPAVDDAGVATTNEVAAAGETVTANGAGVVMPPSTAAMCAVCVR